MPDKPVGAFVLEEPRRLSESLLWPLQREYYRRRGTEAWTSGELPWYVSSNAFIARGYARVVLGFLRDAVAAGWVGPGRPAWVVELAAGSGHFAYLFLKRLHALKKQTPGLEGVDVRYVMTDVAESNLQAWRANERFRPFLEQGLVDFALFDLERDRELRLASGAVLEPAQPVGTLAVLANYAFDSTVQDLFFVRQGALLEGLVALHSEQEEKEPTDPGVMSRLTTSYADRPAREAYYDDPALDALLTEYRDHLGDTAVLVPIGALRCLRALMDISAGRMMLLAGDKGVTGLQEIARQGEPHRVRHGDCFSMDVNFHALGRYAEHHGGLAVHGSQRDRHFRVSALLLGPQPARFPEARLALQELDAFSPFDYYRLTSQVRKDYPEPPLPFLLALMKLGDGDYQFVVRYGKVLAQEAAKATDSLKLELKRALDAAWDSFYPMGVDVAFEIARILAAMQLPLDALRYYRESLRLFGLHHATLYNMGLCLYFLQQPEEALRFMDRALAARADYGPAREWRNRLRAELGV